MISYNNLWKGLIDRGMKKTDLITRAGISSSTLANMGKNQSVSLDTIARVCSALDCKIEDVVSIENTEGIEVHKDVGFGEEEKHLVLT